MSSKSTALILIYNSTLGPYPLHVGFTGHCKTNCTSVIKMDARSLYDVDSWHATSAELPTAVHGKDMAVQLVLTPLLAMGGMVICVVWYWLSLPLPDTQQLIVGGPPSAHQ